MKRVDVPASSLLILLLVSTCLRGPAAPSVASARADEPTDGTPAAAIDQAIADLASPEFARREEASLRLWRLGQTAAAALRAAATGDDPEVATRAQSLLERIRWGITPDMPPSQRRMMDQFRFGSENTRRFIVSRLKESNRLELALDLIAAVPDRTQRDALIRDQLELDAPRLRDLIVEGRLALLERVLRLQAVDAPAMRDYAALLLLTGRLDEGLADARAQLEAAPDAKPRLLLVLLHRAKGDLDAARREAEDLPDAARLRLQLAIEAGDFAWLSDHARRASDAPNAPQQAAPDAKAERDTPGAAVQAQPDKAAPFAATGWPAIPRFGLAAVAHRLAGGAPGARASGQAPSPPVRLPLKDEGSSALPAPLLEAGEESRSEQTETACNRIVQLSSKDAQNAFRAAEALLVADQPGLAIDVLRRAGDRLRAFRLMVARMEFDEALRLAGLDSPTAEFELPELPADNTSEAPSFAPFDEARAREEADRRESRWLLALDTAAVLTRLGYERRAAELFDRLAEAAEKESALNVTEVCRAERLAGRWEAAARRAVEHVEGTPDGRWMAALFGSRGPEAGMWWHILKDENSDAPAGETLRHIRTLLAGKGDRDESLMMARRLRDEMRQADSEPAARWLGLAAVFGSLQSPADEEDCLRAAAEAAPVSAAMLRVGDHFLRRHEWTQAATWYGRAVETDPNLNIARYLQGYAQSRAGRQSLGRARMEAAGLTPLGDGAARLALADALRQRGLPRAARRQWDVILRTDEPHSLAIGNAGRRLGNELAGQDDLQSARHWQQMILSTLKPSASLTRIDDYLKVTHSIHRLRAKGLIAAGDIPQALEEARQAMAILPGDVMCLCDLVPAFDRAITDTSQSAVKDDVDRLFNQAFQVLHKVIEHHPQAAGARNNLAWLCALCERRLEDGLQLARRATELDPDNPVYLDTLAEIHFRLGRKEQALQLARRCVELDPSDEHFRKQVDRFTNAPRSDEP